MTDRQPRKALTQRERYDRDMAGALYIGLFIVFGLPVIAWLVVTCPWWHR